MSQFSRAAVPVADGEKKQRTLKSVSLFTNNFFHLTPVYRRKVYIDDDVKLSGGRFGRTLSMPFPAFMTCDDVFRAFYVPYKSVFPACDDVDNNTLHINAAGNAYSVLSKKPHVSDGDFLKAFLYNTGFVNSGVVGQHDFQTLDSQGNTDYWIFTSRGAQVYKVLKGLGYELPSDCRGAQEWNLIPLLSYCRIIIDHYYPKAYQTNALFSTVLGYLKRDTGVLKFTDAEVRDMLLISGFSFYEDKNFVDCWDNPNSPNNLSAASSKISFVDIDSGLPGLPASKVESDPLVGNGQATIQRNQNNAVAVDLRPFSKFGLNLLNSISDFLKRNQLAGASSIDRFLARHGKRLQYSGERSYYLGECRCPVTVESVAATIQDSSNNLGDLAGKGVSDKGSLYFELNNAQYRGYFLVLCSTLPNGDLFQGIDKDILCVDFLSDYQPEFADTGADMVSAAEIFMDIHNVAFNGLSPTDSKNVYERGYGFYPRWYEHNMDRCNVLGDFNIKSRGSQVLEAAHSLRVLDGAYFNNDNYNVVHSLSFQYPSDSSQYQRLTYLGQNDQDFIEEFIRWNCEYSSRVPLVKDSYNFDSDSQHSSKEVVVDSGTPMN